VRIIRVFPRVTRATPDDQLACYDVPRFFDEADAVHISVAFSWDMPHAEYLAEQWRHVAPVTMGGPALNQPSGDFVGGMYIKHGYTVTSRGCPNRCWFCSVWKREPEMKELPIVDGWNILDDNILACSEGHIRAVFAMLKRQKERVEFTGGLEAKILKPWHVDLLADLRPKQFFFAYDTPDDYEPLVYAAKMLWDAGFTPASHAVRCYVLIGYPKDTMAEAEKRLTDVATLGITPMAMLWKDTNGESKPEWRAFQRLWARPALIHAKLTEEGKR